MRIYADICTLCRPFDDQGQPRIWLETHALCVILQLVETGQVEMVRSPFHDLETARNPWESRRLWVQQCLDLSKVHVPLSQNIKSRALTLEALHVGPMDSLHAAAAEASGCDFLLTCDDRFQKRYRGPITLLNPADFVVSYFKQIQ